MKAFERIFLYTVLAILIFYVFLQDSNVESQEYKLGQYITARSINIVDDEGQPCITLFAGENGGNISIINKDYNFVVNVGVTKDGGGAINIKNKEGISVVDIWDYEFGGIMKFYSNAGVDSVNIKTTDEGGMIGTSNKDGVTGTIMATSDKGGNVFTSNKDGVLGTAMRTDDEGGTIETYNDGIRRFAIIEGGVATFNKDGVIGAIMVSSEEGGEVWTYNKNDEKLVGISQTEEGHGGIWVYDRYGEYPAFYGHER